MSEQTEVVKLRDDFYHDSFPKVVMLIGGLLFLSLLLVSASVYLYLQKPRPITFKVYNEWRVQPAIPVNQPYLTKPQLLQWVSDAVRELFIFNFYDYNRQLERLSHYFTSKGWEVFRDQLNNYANKDEMTKKKLFVNGAPAGAPVVLNEGILSDRYSWWVELPIKLNYKASDRSWEQLLTLQILVVRVPTLNNLYGIAIENIIVPSKTR